MQVRISRPEEMPDQRGREMERHKIDEDKELLKTLTPLKKKNDESEQGIPDIASEIAEYAPIVRLSWEKNIKILTNWMRKHMEAYPETEWWFLALFDITPKSWFYVYACSIWEDRDSDIKINGINYKIYPYECNKYVGLHTLQNKKELANLLGNRDIKKWRCKKKIDNFIYDDKINIKKNIREWKMKIENFIYDDTNDIYKKNK